MSTYLKNMGTWKQTQLKSKTYKEIEKLFEIEMKRVNTFIPMDQDEESSKKHEDENRSKREGEVLESDMSKKQKMNEQEESDKHEEVKKDDDPEEDEMKKHIADGSSKRYSSIIKMIQSIDKEDLEVLWNLVKTKHGDTRPEDEFERHKVSTASTYCCLCSVCATVIKIQLLSDYNCWKDNDDREKIKDMPEKE
ncbi:hypothetical protein Tco_0020498 [Tanacetum coccineum]